MLFYKVVFKRQRVNFRRNYYIVKIGDIFNHRHNLLGFDAVKKVLPYAVFKVFRLANVDYLPARVQHNVHPGVFGQKFQFVVNYAHALIIPKSEYFFKRF